MTAARAVAEGFVRFPYCDVEGLLWAVDDALAEHGLEIINAELGSAEVGCLKIVQREKRKE